MFLIRRFFRHLKEGFLGVFRHFGMSLSSMTAVTITLLLVGIFMVLTYNLQLATETIEEEVSVVALVNYGEDDQENLDRIQAEIETIDGVKTVTYSSKDQEFDYYVNSNQDEELKAFYENYREENPFHDAFIISLTSASALANVTEEVDKISGISSVYDGGLNTYTLVEMMQKVRLLGGILVIALCALAVYLVYNTIKITIAARKDEIWIMRSVGAKNGYIRAPFLVEGIIIGLFGALIPIAAIAYGYMYIYEKVNGNLFEVIFLVEPLPFLYYLGGILAFIGVVVGFVGSYISVAKYLRIR